MLDIEDKTCKIAMSYETTDFRNTVVKFFFRDKSENVTNVRDENTDHINEILFPGDEISGNLDFKKIPQIHVDENEETFFSNSFHASENSIKRDRDRSRKLSLR